MDHVLANFTTLVVRVGTKEHIKYIHRVMKTASRSATFLESLFTSLIIQVSFLFIRENFISIRYFLKLYKKKYLY